MLLHYCTEYSVLYISVLNVDLLLSTAGNILITVCIIIVCIEFFFSRILK